MTRCRHGAYVGGPLGPDYLCGLCESGLNVPIQLEVREIWNEGRQVQGIASYMVDEAWSKLERLPGFELRVLSRCHWGDVEELFYLLGSGAITPTNAAAALQEAYPHSFQDLWSRKTQVPLPLDFRS